MMKSETSAWDDRNGIFQVGDSCKGTKVRVDVIGELLVTHSWETISIERDCCARDLCMNEHCVNERDSCAWNDVRI